MREALDVSDLDAMPALARALAMLDQPAGATVTLGPATTGHWCATCSDYTAIAADVVRIDGRGTTSIATFLHCEDCETRRKDET